MALHTKALMKKNYLKRRYKWHERSKMKQAKPFLTPLTMTLLNRKH